MKEKCTLCSFQCPKNALQCEKGRQFFHHQFMQTSDLTSKLMKCGHILMHKTGKKRGQENILEILSQHDSISQKQLQDILGIEAGSLSEILSKLEQRDYILRYKDQSDKRKSIITITKQGQEKIKNKRSDDEALFDMLSEQENQQLVVILDKVLEEWYKRRLKDQKNINEKSHK